MSAVARRIETPVPATRYLCVDPSHRRQGASRSVDLTQVVFTERGFLTAGALLPPSVDGGPVMVVPEADAVPVGTAAMGQVGAAQGAPALLDPVPPPPGPTRIVEIREPHLVAVTADIERPDRRVGRPWRVVVDCPVVEGIPAGGHRTAFSGIEGTDPDVVVGTPAGSLDSLLADAGASDVAPPSALARLEIAVTALLVSEAIALVVALTLGWASGGLGVAARVAPAWLGFAATMAAAAVVFAALPAFGPRVAAEGGTVEVFALRRFYQSRSSLIGWSAALSATAFLLAILAATVPPMLADTARVDAPVIVMTPTSVGTTANVSATAADLDAGDGVSLLVVAFGPSDPDGVVVASTTADPGNEGRITLRQDVAVQRGWDRLAASAWAAGAPAPDCGPAERIDPGCTVVDLGGTVAA
jgi:hypothetical protein